MATSGTAFTPSYTQPQGSHERYGKPGKETLTRMLDHAMVHVIPILIQTDISIRGLQRVSPSECFI